jgi:deoxyguanosine kinase
MLEEFDGNEFLDDLYADPDRWSLPAQLWFLSDRQKQLIALRRPLSRLLVADYSCAEGLVFAELLLEGREFKLFKMLHDLLTETLISPDVTVYVDAADEILLKRIQSRGRPYERAIDQKYLGQLRKLVREKAIGFCGGSRSLGYLAPGFEFCARAR